MQTSEIFDMAKQPGLESLQFSDILGWGRSL